MFGLSSRERSEARSRAPDFARYYIKMHGESAERQLRLKADRFPRWSYWRRLYRLAAQEARKRM